MKISLYVIAFSIFPLMAFPQQSLKDDLRKQAWEYRKEGYRFQLKGDLKKALSCYQKATEIDPQNAEVYNDIGVVYESLGNTQEALKMYKKAIKIDADYLPAYTNLALLYESLGDIKKATKYWIIRYRKGDRGEYWRNKAKEKLLKLGTYEEVKKDILENEAIDLSKEIIYKREQERLKRTEEARVHLEIGIGLFQQEDFFGALKELNTALRLKPSDEHLREQIYDFYVTAKRAYTKQKVRQYIDEAMGYIDKNDYLAASKKIEEALSLVFSFLRD